MLTTVSESAQSGFGGGGREDRLRMNGQVIPLLSSIPPDRGIRGAERAIRSDFSFNMLAGIPLGRLGLSDSRPGQHRRQLGPREGPGIDIGG